METCFKQSNEKGSRPDQRSLDSDTNNNQPEKSETVNQGRLNPTLYEKHNSRHGPDDKPLDGLGPRQQHHGDGGAPPVMMGGSRMVLSIAA